MTNYSYALFATALGRCGIGWSSDGVACVKLPEATVHSTKSWISEYLGAAQHAEPDPGIQVVIDDLVALLQGVPRNLKRVTLDMAGIAPFHQQVYEVAREVPPGETVTYGDIAQRLGAPGAARAVGQALGRNPFALVVPCHRVLAKSGRLCGFSATGGTATKLRLLTIEGALDQVAKSERQPSRARPRRSGHAH